MEDAANPTSSETSSPQPRQRPVRWWQRLPLSNLQIMLILLIIVGIRLAFDVSQRIIEGQQKIAEQRILEARIAELERERTQLEADKAYYSSPTYIETWAHDEGKMVRDGEKLVVPVYQGKPQPRNPVITTPPPAPLPAWAIWWTLFFDSPPPVPTSTQDSQ
jgi:cell division protein FtsB